MLLKCKLLISFNCSTSHVINHNNFNRRCKISFLPASLRLFLKRFPFPREAPRAGPVSSVMLWLEMALCVISFIPNLLVCVCSSGLGMGSAIVGL